LAEIKRFSLVKPTFQTPYHIDFDWWKQNDRNWRVYLKSYLSPEEQEQFSGDEEEVLIDLVDSETGEIHKVDGLQHLLISRYSDNPEFISHRTSVAESVFRMFLSNGNLPMNAQELSDRIGRPPHIILSLLSGKRIYKGIRPYQTAF
jgi:hypothetical protein